MNIKSLTVAASALVLSNSVDAEIINVDWNITGDTYCATTICNAGEGSSKFYTADRIGSYNVNAGTLLNLNTSSPEYLTSDFVNIAHTAEGTARGHIYRGSALVRQTVVPVPAAVWLFGCGLLGLAGLAGFAKRMKV